VDLLLRRAADYAIQEHREKIRQQRLLEQMMLQVTESANEHLIYDVCNQLLQEMTYAAYAEAAEEFFDGRAVQLTKQILDNGIERLCQQTVQSAYAKLIQEQNSKIQYMRQKRAWRLAKEHF